MLLLLHVILLDWLCNNTLFVLSPMLFYHTELAIRPNMSALPKAADVFNNGVCLAFSLSVALTRSEISVVLQWAPGHQDIRATPPGQTSTEPH